MVPSKSRPNDFGLLRTTARERKMKYRVMRQMRATTIVAAIGTGLLAVLATLSVWPVETAKLAIAEPPADAGYIGAKRCSSCHFKEYMTWSKVPHAKAFEKLPAKYKRGADTQCFKCHITGYGHPKGYKGAATPDLIGVTCEACHGPGSAHEEVAKKFAQKKELTPEEQKMVNAPIYKMIPEGCQACHITQGGHKPHPDYDKE
jgi:hypothetical protein